MTASRFSESDVMRPNSGQPVVHCLVPGDLDVLNGLERIMPDGL